MPRYAPRRPGRLAEAAFELFATDGIDRVSLDQVAAQAGVTKGSLYCHYKSKHELVLAACAYYYRRYQEQVNQALAPLTDPLARLRRVLEMSVHTCIFDRKNRVFTTEIFALSLQHDDVRAGWAQFYDTVREMFVGLVLAARAAGALEAPQPRMAVDMMLAAMEGIKQRATFEPYIADPAEQQGLVEGLLDILRGVRAGEAETS